MRLMLANRYIFSTIKKALKIYLAPFILKLDCCLGIGRFPITLNKKTY